MSDVDKIMEQAKDELREMVAKLKQERDEAVALVEVMRKFARHRNDAEVCCDLLRHSEFSCTCGYDEALSITGPDALREIQARTLEEAADKFSRGIGMCFPQSIKILLIELAAAKRKGE